MRLERLVSADQERLWRFVGDLDGWDRMLPTVDAVSRVGPPGPVAVGTRFRVRQPRLAEAEYVVTEWAPPARFTWEAVARGVRTTARHELLPEGGATRLVLGLEWSGAAAWLVRLLYSRLTRSYLEQEAATFAALATARHP